MANQPAYFFDTSGMLYKRTDREDGATITEAWDVFKKEWGVEPYFDMFSAHPITADEADLIVKLWNKDDAFHDLNIGTIREIGKELLES